MDSILTSIICACKKGNDCEQQRADSSDLAKDILKFVVSSCNLRDVMTAVELKDHIRSVCDAYLVFYKGLREFNRWFFYLVVHNYTTISKYIYPSKIVFSLESLSFEARELMIGDKKVAERSLVILEILCCHHMPKLQPNFFVKENTLGVRSAIDLTRLYHDSKESHLA